MSSATQDQREAVWIRQVAGGDRVAFENLFRAYQARVFHYITRLLADRAAAEELTNDVLVEVWKSAGRYRGQSRLSSWVFGIAHHKVLNEWRRTRPKTVEASEAHSLADPAQSPETRALQESDRASIQAALGELSLEHREVMELTFYQQRSCEEIAEIVHCPVNTVKTRMFHARKKLRDLLSAMGRGKT